MHVDLAAAPPPGQADIAEALVSFQASPPEGLATRVDGALRLHTAVFQPLRVGLIKVLTVVVKDAGGGAGLDVGANPLADRLVDALSALGWGDKARAVLMGEPPAAAPAPTPPAPLATQQLLRPGPLAPAIAADDVEAISRLPAEVVAAVVIGNLRYMPPEPTTPALALAYAEQVGSPWSRLGMLGVLAHGMALASAVGCGGAPRPVVQRACWAPCRVRAPGPGDVDGWLCCAECREC
jgi:hypothetical protein